MNSKAQRKVPAPKKTTTKKTQPKSSTKKTVKTTKTGASPKGIVLLDIEGTTTPITFVADVLFPWITKHLKKYLTSHFGEEETTKDIEALAAQAVQDEKDGVDGVKLVTITGSKTQQIKSVVENVTWLMSGDRKVGALKALQGHMWRSGYASGELKGDLYPDVKPAFDRWKKAGYDLYIYSSGSIEAQKLLFGASVEGNLLPLLSGHFDTTTGHKREQKSYEKIAKAVKMPPNSILFLTDIYAEATAALAAGMQVNILTRPGNKDATAPAKGKYLCPVVKDFKQILK